MPKVELNDLVLGVSPLTETVYAGVLDKRHRLPMWLHKVDVSSDFLRCVIEKVGEGMTLSVAAGEDTWEISVTRVKKEPSTPRKKRSTQKSKK
jgi:hypothetical protein